MVGVLLNRPEGLDTCLRERLEYVLPPDFAPVQLSSGRKGRFFRGQASTHMHGTFRVEMVTGFGISHSTGQFNTVLSENLPFYSHLTLREDASAQLHFHSSFFWATHSCSPCLLREHDLHIPIFAGTRIPVLKLNQCRCIRQQRLGTINHEILGPVFCPPCCRLF